MAGDKKSAPLDMKVANEILDRMLEGGQKPKARPTKTEQLQELKPKVEALLANGYTWDEVTRALSGAGAVSKDTLRHAMRVKPALKKARKKKAVAVAPVHREPKAAEKRMAGPPAQDPADYAKNRL